MSWNSDILRNDMWKEDRLPTNGFSGNFSIKIPNTADERKGEHWHTDDLAKTNLHMLRNQIACDVDFIVHSGEAKTTIPAHSFMLISRSPVFEAMLTTDFKERETKKIDIEDISEQDFNDFLTFIYTQKTTVTEKNVLQLRYAANKYMIQSLSNQCSTFLENNINIGNVCVILESSLFYKDDVSAQRCLDFIAPKAVHILGTDGFKSLSNQSLKLILDMDSLYIQREDRVFKAAMDWACHQLQLKSSDVTDQLVRETLGDCLYQIRFGDLSSAMLTRTVGLSEVLTDREFRLFSNYCLNRTGNIRSDLKKLGFNLAPRRNCPQYPHKEHTHYRRDVFGDHLGHY